MRSSDGVAVGEALDDLGVALDQAVAVLPTDSRSRPWLVRARNELRELRADLASPGGGGSIGPAQVSWLEARHAEVSREPVPWQALPFPVSKASARLRRAGSLCRRAARLARCEQASPTACEYLARLAKLLFALARTVDGPHVRVLVDAASLARLAPE